MLTRPVLQDPSFNPFGYARLATRAASSEGGAAAACPSNVQNFFKTIFSMGNSSQGIQQIHQQLHLCRSSLPISSYNDVNSTLAPFFRVLWTVGVRFCATLLAGCARPCWLQCCTLQSSSFSIVHCMADKPCTSNHASRRTWIVHMRGSLLQRDNAAVHTLCQTRWEGWPRNAQKVGNCITDRCSVRETLPCDLSVQPVST